MFDHLKKSITDSRKRIAAIELHRLEVIRQSHKRKVLRQIHERRRLRQIDDAAWQRVERKLDAALQRWKGGQ